MREALGRVGQGRVGWRDRLWQVRVTAAGHNQHSSQYRRNEPITGCEAGGRQTGMKEGRDVTRTDS